MRDNRLVAYTARQLGLRAPLAEASDAVNELTKESLADDIVRCVAPGATIAVLGMSYKPDLARPQFPQRPRGGDFAALEERHARRV